MASRPLNRTAAKHAHRRPVQPVVPVLPLVASAQGNRKGKEKAKAETKDVEADAAQRSDAKSNLQDKEAEEVSESLPEKESRNGAIPEDTSDIKAEPTGEKRTRSPVINGNASETEAVSSYEHVAAVPTSPQACPVSEQSHGNESPTRPTMSIDTTPAQAIKTSGSPISGQSDQDVSFENLPDEKYLLSEIEEEINTVHVDDEKTPILSFADTDSSRNNQPMINGFANHRQSVTLPEVLPGRGGTPHVGLHHEPHQSNGSASSQLPVLPLLQEHLLYLAHSKQMYDMIIQINQPDSSLPPAMHYAHSPLLLRSERMTALMPEWDVNAQARFLSLFPPRILQPHAFEAALRFFYSDQVQTAESLIPRNVPLDRQSRSQLFDYIMSYWIAGTELGLQPVTARAFQMAKEVLDWEIVEQVVKEAYDLRSFSPPTPDEKASSEASAVADALMNIVFQLFAFRFPSQDFRLQSDAPSAALPSRFAQLEVGRASANPALASMVFGSMPSSSSPTIPVDASISNIFLNLDFHDLAALSSALVSAQGASALPLVEQVVEERERRRGQTVNNRSVVNKRRLADSSTWEIAAWREYIEDGQIKRQNVGFLLPAKPR